MRGPNFATTAAERALIVNIVARYETDFSPPPGYDRLSLIMDITACHATGTPLDLQKFLDFPLPDFIHDLAGIVGHINRETGKLEHCFLPRCAKPEGN